MARSRIVTAPSQETFRTAAADCPLGPRLVQNALSHSDWTIPTGSVISQYARTIRKELEGKTVAPATDEKSRDPTLYTIDQLSAQSGVPSRTIRYYQSEGALRAPERRGRVALYDDDHLDRLRLISELQTRGLSLGLISDLIRRTAPGNLSVVEWLGLTERLAIPWSEDQSEELSQTDLSQRLGQSGLEVLDRLIETGVVTRMPGGCFHVSSPALLDMLGELDAVGIDPQTSIESASAIRRHLAAGIDEVVTLIIERAGQGFGRQHEATELMAAIDAFKPAATRAVLLIFEQEVERSLRAAGWPPNESDEVTRQRPTTR